MVVLEESLILVINLARTDEMITYPARGDTSEIVRLAVGLMCSQPR